jgi:predicted alpha/beta-fold hydrolase
MYLCLGDECPGFRKHRAERLPQIPLEAYRLPIIAESDYKAPLMCSSPHIQTVIPILFRKVPGVTYERERIDTPDEDFIHVDWSRVGSRRLAIVTHGLEGDSGRAYMKGMVKALNRTGWDAVAMNFRGCSGEPNRKLRLYHSGETKDLHTVVSHVAALDRYDELALVGFSLGGNAILKYLGEPDHEKPVIVKAAVTVSVPCDLKGCSDRLGESRNRPYLRRFLKLLHRKIQTKALMFPDKVNDKGYEQISKLREFDDRYTAPLHGFKDANDYYEKASSRQFLPAISVPALVINAADDPFLSPSCFPIDEAKANPNLFLEIPPHGGHVGFMAFNHDGQYWSEKRAAAFLESVGTYRRSFH